MEIRTRKALVEAVDRLGVWKKGGQRAPHKPLLLLLALGRVQRGEPRLAEFQDIEAPLRDLLLRFGPPRKSHHPEYPFWWLRTDGLWEVPGGDDLPLRGHGKEPLLSAVRDRRVEGGLPVSVDGILRAEPSLIADLAEQILLQHFPSSLHADILEAVGIDTGERVHSSRRRRDPAFVEKVLTAYEHRCAFCGLQLLLDRMVVGLEAAHVRWHASGGPAVVENGLALCPLHHKLLDLGALGISDRHEILVSTRVVGGEEGRSAVEGLQGRPIRGPQRGQSPVALPHIRWHAKEVFKPPHREAG